MNGDPLISDVAASDIAAGVPVEDRQRHIRHPLLYIGQACSHLIDHQSILFQPTYL